LISTLGRPAFTSQVAERAGPDTEERETWMLNLRRIVAATGMALVLASVAASCSASSGANGRTGGETVIPGFPKAPFSLRQDWFTLETSGAPHATLSVVKSKNAFPALIRYAGGAPLAPAEILVEPQTFPSGKVVEGYDIRYPDRIELDIRPSDRPLDIAAEVGKTSLPNIKGETHFYRKTIVRGLDAAETVAGVQKWSSGDENRYPAVLEWSEPGGSGVPYVTYVLYGDGTTAMLHAIASELRSFP
jgi:hypothetical protein